MSLPRRNMWVNAKSSFAVEHRWIIPPGSWEIQTFCSSFIPVTNGLRIRFWILPSMKKHGIYAEVDGTDHRQVWTLKLSAMVLNQNTAQKLQVAYQGCVGNFVVQERERWGLPEFINFSQLSAGANTISGHLLLIIKADLVSFSLSHEFGPLYLVEWIRNCHSLLVKDVIVIDGENCQHFVSGLLLSARSRFFHAMLQKWTLEGYTRVVRFPEMDSRTCRMFLEYLETLKLPLSTDWVSLLTVAEQYGVDELQYTIEWKLEPGTDMMHPDRYFLWSAREKSRLWRMVPGLFFK